MLSRGNLKVAYFYYTVSKRERKEKGEKTYYPTLLWTLSSSYRVQARAVERTNKTIECWTHPKPTVNRRLPIGGVFAIPGELHPGNEVTQAEVFIRIAQANHVRAGERHRLLTNMYLPRLGPISSSVYLCARASACMRACLRASVGRDGPTCGYQHERD